MITDDQLSAALTLLAESALPLSKAVGRKIGHEEGAAIKKAEAFVNIRTEAVGITIGEAEARAKCSEGYREALRAYVRAAEEEALLRAQRVHAEAVIECWRSEQANRRASNVV